MSTNFDFESSWKMAQVLAKSPLVGRDYQNQPESILLVAMSGSSFGWNMAESLRQMQIISGSVGVRPEAILGLCRAAGHSITGEVVDGVATVHGKRADNGDEMTVSFSRADAKAAGLSGRGAWKTYEDAMLWTRAISKLGRMLFPDVGVSYTIEEIGGAIDADGGPVDDTPSVGMLSVSEVKTAGMARYTDAGFTVPDAKPYLTSIWTSLSMPASGSWVTAEQNEAFHSKIDDDLAGSAPQPDEVLSDAEVAALLDEAAEEHTVAGDPEQSDDPMSVLS